MRNNILILISIMILLPFWTLGEVTTGNDMNDSNTGKITIHVLNDFGKEIEGVIVSIELIGLESGPLREAMSDPKGKLIFEYTPLNYSCKFISYKFNSDLYSTNSKLYINKDKTGTSYKINESIFFDKDLELYLILEPKDIVIKDNKIIYTKIYGESLDIYLKDLLVTYFEESMANNFSIKSTNFKVENGVVQYINKLNVEDLVEDIGIYHGDETTPFTTININITPRELSVISKDNEFIYQDETTEYMGSITFSNVLKGENLASECSDLGTRNGIFYFNITLKDNPPFLASNYSLNPQGDMSIKLKNENASVQRPLINNSSELKDWYNSDVTLKAAEGFTINCDQTEPSSSLKTEVTITKDGEYTYTMKRINLSTAFSSTVKIDKTPPVVTVNPTNLYFEMNISDNLSGIDNITLDGNPISLDDLKDNIYKGSSSEGNHIVKVTDKAGNVNTVEFALSKKIVYIDDFIFTSNTYTGLEISTSAKVKEDETDNVIKDADINYTYYTDKDKTTKTTSDNSGASSEGAALKFAGDYFVEATYAGSDECKKAEKTTAFTINKKELTVKPIPNLKIYQDEVPLYTIEGFIDGETPLFDGTLKVENNLITSDDKFKLKDEFNRNYSFTVESGISIELFNENAKDAAATQNSPSIINGWSTNDITITPPEGFKIALTNYELRSEPIFKDNIIWNKEGSYDLTYSLQRTIGEQNIYADKTMTVKLDKTNPFLSVSTNYLHYILTFSDELGSGIDQLFIDNLSITLTDNATSYEGTSVAGTYTAKVIDKAGHANEMKFTLKQYVPPVITYYTVTLPAIEGVSTDPVADNYEVEAYNNFSFYLSLEEGYTQQSQPVVKANGDIISPNANGKYTIKFVNRDISIAIEGILRDEPTANERIDNDIHIRLSAGAIHISTPKAIHFHLIDSSGRIIRNSLLSSGENSVNNLAAGLYILYFEGYTGKKVIVHD